MQPGSMSADNYCMATLTGGGERGASVAETALLIAVVALVAVVALRALGSSGGDSLDQAGKGIHHAATPTSAPGSGSSGGGSGTGGSGGAGPIAGGGPGTSTTTAPPVPATTAPPAPTTTASPAPTTTAPPAPATASLDGGEGVRVGSSRWQASADLALDAGPDGAPVSGTATVIVRTQRANGQWTSDTIQVPVDDGTGTISTGPYARTGGSRIIAVEYEVVGIELDGVREWDGERASISIDRPA